jgi:hypothetical protein
LTYYHGNTIGYQLNIGSDGYMTFDSGLRSAVAGIMALLAVGVLSACTTSNAVDDTLAVAPPPPRSGQPVNTGAYPNINIVPEGATAQLSDAETASRKSDLYSAQAAQRRPGEASAAYVERLRRLQQLGSTHAAAALAEIEASQ